VEGCSKGACPVECRSARELGPVLHSEPEFGYDAPNLRQVLSDWNSGIPFPIRGVRPQFSLPNDDDATEEDDAKIDDATEADDVKIEDATEEDDAKIEDATEADDAKIDDATEEDDAKIDDATEARSRRDAALVFGTYDESKSELWLCSCFSDKQGSEGHGQDVEVCPNRNCREIRPYALTQQSKPCKKCVQLGNRCNYYNGAHSYSHS